MESVSLKTDLKILRGAIREFYGKLPVSELLGNSRLISKIELLEKQLQRILSDADLR